MANRDRYGTTRRDQGGMVPMGADLFSSPFTVMRRMADEMNQLLNAGMGAASSMMPGGGTHMPNVDVRETAGSYVVEAEMPGVRAKDIDLSVQGDSLVIRGQSSRHEESQEQGYYVSERRYGSFYREIPLPGQVDPDKCSAHFEDGVLEVRLPKSGQGAGKRIQVNAGQEQGQQKQAGAGKSGPGGTVPGTAERQSQQGVEAATANQSYVGETSGKSAKESAEVFQEDEEEQKTGRK